jgi:hypothetical protein
MVMAVDVFNEIFALQRPERTTMKLMKETEKDME